jgi:2-phospho-L-lactate guanylyltransferase
MRSAPPSLARPAGVVVPIRAFTMGKARLAPALHARARADLAQQMAERVLDAAGPLPTVIVSSAPEVRAWCAERGLERVDDPGSLDAAAARGLAWCGERGLERAIVAHADLPYATEGGLLRFSTDGADRVVAIVPCHRGDGTPVLAVPTDARFAFAYGPGSFRRHAESAGAARCGVRIVNDPTLAFDVDLPQDLAQLRAGVQL